MALNGIMRSERDVQQDNAKEIEQLKGKMEDLVKETNQFTYIVTHDLQAPLRTISGFLELIEKRYAGQLDDSGKQFIEFAMKGSLKMKSLIFDLLEYSRLSSIEQVIAPTDLNEILLSVQQELKPEMDNSAALIESVPLPVINADKRLISLLFRHLLDNAIKFRGADIPLVKIRTKQYDGLLELSFTDNGIGIDPSFLEKIFIIFRRLHTDELKYPGTGTGLAVCKKIAELHGGSIKADSFPGKGTTITIQLATE